MLCIWPVAHGKILCTVLFIHMQHTVCDIQYTQQQQQQKKNSNRKKRVYRHVMHWMMDDIITLKGEEVDADSRAHVRYAPCPFHLFAFDGWHSNADTAQERNYQWTCSSSRFFYMGKYIERMKVFRMCFIVFSHFYPVVFPHFWSPLTFLTGFTEFIY